MLNRKKNLHTGRSVWLSYNSPKIPTEKLKSDQKADIVVVGAGITGAMAAEELSGAGFSVIVLDRRSPLRGSTLVTTALLQYEIDEPLIHLKKKIGETKAIRAWRRSKIGLESLAAKIESLRINCGLKRKNSLYLAGNILNAEELKEEQANRNAIGLYSDFLSRKQLFDSYKINKTAALKAYDSLSVNPRQMAAGFLLKAVEKNARIFSPVEVKEVKNHSKGAAIITKEGPVISCRYVIFATGYEIPKYVKAHKHSINSTWAIATKKQPKKLWPEQSFIWEAASPYLYLRTTADGRVICGGEDEEFSSEEKRDNLIEKKTRILEKKLQKLFPKLDSKAEFAWAGSFGASPTGLPTIDVIPGMKNCFVIMAFGGNGITYSRIAAEIINAKLIGKEDPDSELFQL